MAAAPPLTLLLLILISGEALSLTLTSSTTRISQLGTPNLTMTCASGDQIEASETQRHSEFSEIYRMRILKRESEKWNPIVVMDSDWKEPKSTEGLQGAGHIAIHSKDSSWVQATWELATNETGGEYRCDVVGSSWDGQGVSVRSPSVYIDVEVPLTLYDLMKMMQNSNKQDDATFKDMSKQMNQKLQAIEDRIDQYKISVDAVENETLVSKEDIGQLEVRFETILEDFYEHWPQGTYGTLEPRSGCPLNIGVDWKNNGYRRHHTESTERNKDEVSTPNHVDTPVISRSGKENYVYQRFCVVKTQSQERPWPAGQYCINQKGSCPVGFDTGRIHWDDEDSNSASTSGGELPSGTYNTGYTDLYYCCRNDSSYKFPIRLPRSKAFYLYRYGGHCQEVMGMKVTPEYIFFDAQCCGSKYYDYTPDGKESLPDVKLELCYYENISN